MNYSDSLRSLYEDRQLVYDVLDNLPLGVITLDASAAPIFVNQTLADLVVMPLKDILNAPFEKLSAWLTAEKESWDLFNICISGKNVTSKGHLLTNGGERIPVNIDGFPLYNKLGQIFGILVLFQDLRQQLVWERSQQEYRHILDSINMAMVAIDTNGIITNCNKSVSDFCHAQPQGLIGRYISEASTKFDHLGTILLQTLKMGEPISVPELAFEIDENRHVVSMECAPLKDAAGIITGAVALCRDISMQRFMEDEAKRAEKLAIVGELAAGIAHEIRNPLTSVKGFIQLLTNRFPQNAPEQDYLEIMMEELDRANNIIKNFLLLAKPATPKLQLQDINHLLDDLLKLVEGEALMAEVELFRSFSPEVPLMVIETEAIKQVFLNLLQNSIQAMPSGGKLTILTEYSPENNTNLVKIIDTGKGMSKFQLNHLGRPFFTSRNNGTGLGLTVSYRIVHHHKGKIEVESEENVGTTFTVILPVII